MFRFKMKAKKLIFYFVKNSRDQNWKKKTSFAKEFSIEFASKLKNMNTFTFLK